jgi:hypothetical protein
MAYTVSCRDFPTLQCDWFYRGEDIGQLLVETFKHNVEKHTKIHREHQTKLEVWQMIAYQLSLVKKSEN